MTDFQNYIETSGQLLQKGTIRSLQVNMGYRCNLRCTHCHVAASPDRQEIMAVSVIKDVLHFADRIGVKVVDITGGAPEMNPHLTDLISGLKQIRSIEQVLLRTNLVILEEAEYHYLPAYFAEQGVELIASMPCYTEENVELQRGKGVYHKNINILQKLNLLGYGSEATGLKLHLVYNPGSGFLPGPQQELEVTYKAYLKNNFGVVFNSLFTITNMPIGRFRDYLQQQGLLAEYLDLLVSSYSADNLAKVMCRELVNVDWQGRLYDCDFNQALRLSATTGDQRIGQISLKDLVGKPITVGNHCFACVAGSGSSCQGSLHDKADQ